MGGVADRARCIPILPSPDIAATRGFYIDELGFQPVGQPLDDYLMVRRGEMEIHFWRSDDVELPKVSSCYIRGTEVAELHAEYTARQVERLSAFSVRPWGMKEFYVHDPHGNLLRFGCDADDS